MNGECSEVFFAVQEVLAAPDLGGGGQVEALPQPDPERARRLHGPGAPHDEGGRARPEGPEGLRGGRVGIDEVRGHLLSPVQLRVAVAEDAIQEAVRLDHGEGSGAE
jgi:hypothetical protein